MTKTTNKLIKEITEKINPVIDKEIFKDKEKRDVDIIKLLYDIKKIMEKYR